MLEKSLSTLFALTVMTEFLTELIKESLPFIQRVPSKWIAAAVGVSLSFLTENGVLSLIGGYARYPYLDYFLTGLIMSRGSGVIHDLIDALLGFSRRYSANP